MIIINLFISYGCTKTPYAWSKAANMAFFALTRVTYALGWMMLIFYIILGHSRVGLFVLSNPPMNAAGRLVYISYLISPIIMMVVYSNTYSGVFMTLVGNITLGMGHMTLAFTFGALIFILIQWPIMNAIRMYLHPYISHHNIVIKHHQ